MQGTSTNFRMEFYVCGWTRNDCVSRSSLFDSIAHYIDGAMRLGLPSEDIENDILDRFPALFTDAELDLSGDVPHLMLAPV